jgi:hypothetical protein
VTAIDTPEDWKLDIPGFCLLRGTAHIDAEKIYMDRVSVQDDYWLELEAILQEYFALYWRIEWFDLTVSSLETCSPVPEFADLVKPL